MSMYVETLNLKQERKTNKIDIFDLLIRFIGVFLCEKRLTVVWFYRIIIAYHFLLLHS